MPLSIGTRIGPYKVLNLIGAGGMGEVYRARDEKLNRDVALKILPDTLAANADRLARLRREAQLLASLNHPNIGHIYGFEDSGPSHALVLEFIDGRTLADRLVEGRLDASIALPIARQIAEALEAAHDQGVIHRDLKPANIKIRPDGVVKVLDFGIAKSDEPPPGPDLPTVTLPSGATRAGAVLGTAGYMSPEQARGETVDKRTDIWAFGCVLFEMLSGRLAFPGRTTSDTIAAVLTAEPDWSLLPDSTAPAIHELLRRCVEKDPKRRLRDIGDARIEIDRLAQAGPDTRATTSVERRQPAAGDADTAVREPRKAGWLLWVGLPIALLIGLALLGFAIFTRKTGPVTSPADYVQLTDFTDSATAPSLSADGKMVTFVRGGGPFLSDGQIYVKLLPNGESVRLTNDNEIKYAPAFSPDGSRVAYTVVTRGSWDTYTVPLPGGTPTQLLPNASGLSWIGDRQVLFSEIQAGAGFHMGIVTATEARADERKIYFPSHERAMAHYSYPSPDRKSVLLVEMDRAAIWQRCRLVPFDGSSAGRQVGPDGPCTAAAWSQDGRWMYFSVAVDDHFHLWRQSFPDGAPEQITSGPTEEQGVAVAPDGKSLITSIGVRQSAIWIHDAAGERAIAAEGFVEAPRLSRDDKTMFYLQRRERTAHAAELREVDIASGRSTSVLPGYAIQDFDLSNDEKQIVFSTLEPGGESLIWLASRDRLSAPRQIGKSGDLVSFGAPGEIIFRGLEKQANFLYRMKLDGSGRERFASRAILEKFGASPDGKFVIALVGAEGASMSASGGQIQTVAISADGQTVAKICDDYCQSTWSADGRFLNVVISRTGSSTASGGRTLVFAVPSGRSLPDFPSAGVDVDGPLQIPVARVIPQTFAVPAADPSTYVFLKTSFPRNLYMIPMR
jgi:Tol biopolymer transport system component